MMMIMTMMMKSFNQFIFPKCVKCTKLIPSIMDLLHDSLHIHIDVELKRPGCRPHIDTSMYLASLGADKEDVLVAKKAAEEVEPQEPSESPELSCSLVSFIAEHASNG